MSVDYLAGLSESKKSKEKYKVGSKYFGLSDRAMEQLVNLKLDREIYEYDPETPIRPESTLGLINAIIANTSFWQKIDLLLWKYSYAKAVEKLGEDAYVDQSLTHPELPRRAMLFEPYAYDADLLRYYMSQQFQRLADNCCDELYPSRYEQIVDFLSKYREGTLDLF